MRWVAMTSAVLVAAAPLSAPIANAVDVFPPAAGTTVYTLEPLDYNLYPAMRQVFNGACADAGVDCVKVPTPASLDPTHVKGVIGERGSIAKGAESLDATLRGDGDDTASLIFGYSQGGQVAGFWLRNYSADAASYANKDDTSFLLIGDPENTYGVPWAPKVPTDTGYQVTELWVQYDGWADWPTRPNLLAVANAVYGQLFVHPTAYNSVDPNSPDNIHWTDGDMTYVMVPTDDVPILTPLRKIGLGSLADKLNDSVKKQIEAAYDRPSTQAEADALSAANAAKSTTTTLKTVATPAAPTVKPAAKPTTKRAAAVPARPAKASAAAAKAPGQFKKAARSSRRATAGT
jgi:diacyltrehalose acyltransferase